jgi:hypothetical protein
MDPHTRKLKEPKFFNGSVVTRIAFRSGGKVVSQYEWINDRYVDTVGNGPSLIPITSISKTSKL